MIKLLNYEWPITENGKAYITLTSKDVSTTGTILHVATIDYWRGYVDDENTTLTFRVSAKTSTPNSLRGGYANGFNVFENMDEEHPDNPYYDYTDTNYQTNR